MAVKVRSCSRRREDVMMFLPSLSKMESSDDDDGFGPRYLFLFCPCAKHDGVVLGVVAVVIVIIIIIFCLFSLTLVSVFFLTESRVVGKV